MTTQFKTRRTTTHKTACMMALLASSAAAGCSAADDGAFDDETSSASSALIAERNYRSSGMDRFTYASALGGHEALVYAAPGCRKNEAGADCPVIVFHHGDV